MSSQHPSTQAVRKPMPVPGPLLPREKKGERWLSSVIAILCFLATLSAIGALAADRAAHGWARELRGEATVQVRPRVNETGPTAAGRAAEALSGVKGVDEAYALDRKASERLIAPWVGEAVLPDLPLPHLVVVRLNEKQPASAPTLSRALAEAGVDATVDDHSLWRGEVERAAGIVTILAISAFLLTAGATAAVIAYATRTGMTAQAGIISTLSLNGASDAQVAGLYQSRFGKLSLMAGIVGSVTAGMAMIFLRLLGGEAGVTPALPVQFSDIAAVVVCPVLAGLTAVLAARFTALAKLAGHG